MGARMLLIGPGPGPKNVLAEIDGRKGVLTYREWKTKYARSQVAEKTYRSVIGVVQFDPREGEAAGKPIRNITIRQVGFKEQAVKVSLTLWPSHERVAVGKGDLVFAEGAYSQGKGEKDGVPVTYHNLSVSRFLNLGTTDEGERPETENTGDVDEAADDDIPF